MATGPLAREPIPRHTKRKEKRNELGWIILLIAAVLWYLLLERRIPKRGGLG